MTRIVVPVQSAEFVVFLAGPARNFFSSGHKSSGAEPAICREKHAPRVDGADSTFAGTVTMGNGTVDSPPFA